MPNKLQAYAEQAERTARQITGSHLAWTAFLTTAARLYKYPYNEQLMIYMQRPEATACAEYDFWNAKMGRYVRRGSTGIALIDATGYKPRLKYVFDGSDTGGKENARRVNLWELKDAHTDSVSAMLERNYGVSGKNGLAEQFENVASQLAAEYWRDHSRDILGIVADSYLEEYDDYNIEVAFKNAAAVSITYSLMSRCGMQPEDHFEHEDFFSIRAEVGALLDLASHKLQRFLCHLKDAPLKHHVLDDVHPCTDPCLRSFVTHEADTGAGKEVLRIFAEQQHGRRADFLFSASFGEKFLVLPEVFLRAFPIADP